MVNTPTQETFTNTEWAIVQRLHTPGHVQKYLSSVPYNWETEGGTARTFREVLRLHTAHCLEAALAAAVIMEQHGYPPLLLSIASRDKLDHVVFIFKENGKWGSIGRSRDVGLHGRRAVFRSLRDLTWSYFDPYVDFTGRIVGYGLADLRELHGYDWRFSSRNVPKIERHLNEIPHRKLTSSNKRYRQLLKCYKQWKKEKPGEPFVDYPHRDRWML
jgi:hypothetical protein